MTERILIGTRKGSFFAEKKASGWSLKLAGHSGVGVNFVAKDPHSGHLWAALGHGHWGAKLSRSKDNGATWADSTQIKYPPGARYLAPPDPSEQAAADEPTRYTARNATLLKLWVLAFDGHGKMYVGTIPGGVFTSEDGGESFELNRPLWNHDSRGGDLFSTEGNGKTHWFGTPASDGEFAPGIHSIEIDPRNPKRVLVGISTAGVLETTDGGQTWQGKNRGLLNDYLPEPEAEWGHDAHALSICKGNPDHVWQQNHCGVFYSADNAASWKRVSQKDVGVHFGFPIVADEADGQRAWVVPGTSDMERMAIGGGLFVGRTTNGGASWEQLRRGLPQENAHDVVYRHALAKSGSRLAFGSTTGNLYVTEDHGDSWQTLGNNLPPIYSVRFG
jgi:photosystem II stability/assembly factor-like uncharacterized protein